MNKPLISVIISTFNQADSLDKSLTNVFNQTLKNLEVIIINDASTDQTANKLLKWKSKYPHKITIITNSKNLGLTKSLNIGIKHAKGKYIARLDTDDWWQPSKLKKQKEYLQKNPDHGIVGTYYINHRNKKTKKVTLPKTDHEIKKQIYKKNPFGHSCVMIDKKILKSVNGYDEKIRYGQDRELWFRLAPYTRFINLPDYLTHRTITPTSKKPQQVKQTCKTVHKYIKKNKASYYNYLYLIQPLLLLLVPQKIRTLVRKII